MKWNLILILALLFIACNSTSEEEAAQPDAAKSVPEKTERNVSIKKIPEFAEMVTSVDNLRLREQPGSEGKEVMRLPERSVVIPTGKKTDLKQNVSLRGFSFNEPWIEVMVDDKIKGWVYTGAIDLQPNTSKFADELFEARCTRFFGTVSNSVAIYRKNFREANSAQDLKLVYEEALIIGDDASKAFDNRCRIKEIPTGDIDFLWVKAALPGFIITKGPKLERIKFFLDINQFIEKAVLTEKKDDDAAFNFLKEITGNSLLLPYREWIKTTSLSGGVSKLGAGIHTRFLDDIGMLHQENNLFIDGLITDECNFLLEDIVSNTKGYQRGKEAILAEIQKIKAKDYKFLTSEQKTSIDNRISQFSDLVGNKILVNEKVGRN